MTQFEGDLAQSHQVIGAVQAETGHPAAALASFERAGDPRERRALKPIGHGLPEPPGPEPCVCRACHRAERAQVAGCARVSAGDRHHGARREPAAERLPPLQSGVFPLAAIWRRGRARLGAHGRRRRSLRRAGGATRFAARQAPACSTLRLCARTPISIRCAARPDFQELLLDLSFPADPFAGPPPGEGARTRRNETD